MSRIAISTFGGLRLHGFGGRHPLRLRTRRAAALLGVLANSRNASQARDTVIDLLWSDARGAQGRHRLRQALSEIRGTLGDDVIVTVGDAIQLRHDVRVDVHLFERCLRRDTTRALDVACALYRGDFLAGLNLPESGYQLWITAERTRFRQLAIEALERRLQRASETGSQPTMMRLALQLITIEPCHEGGHRTLMTIYGGSGRLSAVLQQYGVLTQLLDRELGVEPERQTQDLLRKMMTARRDRNPENRGARLHPARAQQARELRNH